MTRNQTHPNNNPLIPTRDEVKAFNPHHGPAFAYNRALLTDQNIEVELEQLRHLAHFGDLTPIEHRLIHLLDAIQWLNNHNNR